MACASCGAARPAGDPGCKTPAYPMAARCALPRRNCPGRAGPAGSLDDLPRATCRICTYAAGGELSIDQYGEGDGFGVSWEGAEGTHLLGTVFSRAWADRRREMPPAGIVTHPHGLRAVLGWLTTLPVVPKTLRSTRATQRPDGPRHSARAWSAGHGGMGLAGDRLCAALPSAGRRSCVSLVEAMPPTAPWSRDLFTLRWRALAWRALSCTGVGQQPRS